MDKKILTSLGISCAAHALLVAGAAYLSIGAPAAVPSKGEKIFHVKMAPDNLPLKRMLIARAGSEGPVKDVPGFGGPLSDTLAAGLEDATGVAPGKDEEPRGLVSSYTAQEKAALPDKRLGTPAHEKPRGRAIRADIIETGTKTLPIPPETGLPASPEEVYLPDEFVKEMPGFTPSVAATGLGALPYRPFQGSGHGGAMGGGGGGGRYSADEYLVADLVVYKDPADGQKYFKITIMAGRDAAKFKVLPKEVTFLIDCSLSIKPERMEEFKKGFTYCLDHLGKDDTFNVVSFKESTQALSPFPLANTPPTIIRAKRFISKLLPANSTDVYRALTGVIERPPARRPSYILLVSDGRPTIGIRDSREIVVKINRSNQGVRPIFSYSGGARTNRYLLDFVAYRNRGWSEYAERTQGIAKGLSALYMKIKDPLLLNLRYHFSGISTDEIYPKTLPDLYRGAAFTIFGRYDTENEFSMQLRGDVGDATLEPIFSDAFSNARQGSKEIARQWAFNKVYHLIGKLAEKDDPELIRQIRELCAKFGITTPYSDGVREP